MKNKFLIDIDTDRKETVLIQKETGMPEGKEEANEMVLKDMACLCEAVVTMIHVAEECGARKSAESVRICIKHITDGFADPTYKGFIRHE